MVENAGFLKDSIDTTYEFLILLKNLPNEMQCYRKFERIYRYNIQDLEYSVPQDGQEGLEQGRSLLTTGLLCNKFGMNHLMEIWNQKSEVEFLCKKPDDYL